MTTRTWMILAVALLLVGTAAAAQTGGDTIAVPLSDPSRPMRLEVSLLNGGITVEAYEGSEVLVEASERPGSKKKEPAESGGMMRIPNTGFGLTIEEDDNTVSVSADWSRRPIDLDIRVPRRASLHLGTVNNGDIRVSGAAGNHELSNTNGSIHALEVSGSVVANTTNGPVEVTFVDMDSDQPMSFTTWNGDVKVTMPAGLAADLRLEAGQGDVFTDFEIELEPMTTRMQRDDGGGSFRVRLERSVRGAIGGGGPELHFKTFNGNIYLRKLGG